MNSTSLTEGQLFTIEALNRIEGFAWPEDAEFACAFNIINGRNFGVEFYIERPAPNNAIEAFKGALSKDNPTKVILGQHPDWRNSLITREQFDSVDGWVRNDGNKPVISGDFDLLLADGEAIYFSDISVDRWDWSVPCKGGVAITHWRHNKPIKETEMQNPKLYKKQDCIETLIDKRKDAIEQKRIALAALEEAEAKERELMLSIQAWAESYGFDISVLDESDEKPDVEPKHEPELVITDWRDLRVGDVVRCWGKDYEMFVVDVYLDSNCDEAVFLARTKNGSRYTVHDGDWKFIRRQSK